MIFYSESNITFSSHSHRLGRYLCNHNIHWVFSIGLTAFILRLIWFETWRGTVRLGWTGQKKENLPSLRTSGLVREQRGIYTEFDNLFEDRREIQFPVLGGYKVVRACRRVWFPYLFYFVDVPHAPRSVHVCGIFTY